MITLLAAVANQIAGNKKISQGIHKYKNKKLFLLLGRKEKEREFIKALALGAFQTKKKESPMKLEVPQKNLY